MIIMDEKSIEAGLSRVAFFIMLVCIVVSIAIIVGVYLYIQLLVTNSEQWLDMIRSMDNACITVSSITLATFFAIMALMVSRRPDKSLPWWVFTMAIPSLGGALTGLFSLFFSYNPSVITFDASKNLLVLAMGFTIVSGVLLFIIMNFLKDSFLVAPASP